MFADYPQETSQNGRPLFPSEPWMELSEPGLSDFLQSVPVSTESPLTTTESPLIAGFDLGSNWPIMAIIGIGALIALRGKKKESHATRRPRKRTRRSRKRVERRSIGKLRR